MTAQPIEPTNVHSIQGQEFPPSDIPRFEGEEVTGTKAKISSVTGLDVADQVFRMDETVRLVVECRVVGVDHKVTPDGKLERVHNFKAIDSVVIDWKLDLDSLRDGLA